MRGCAGPIRSTGVRQSACFAVAQGRTTSTSTSTLPQYLLSIQSEHALPFTLVSTTVDYFVRLTTHALDSSLMPIPRLSIF